MAKEMGADCVVKVTSKDAKEVAAQVIEALGEKPDFTIVCSGAPPSTRTAIFATKSGGCVVLVGMGPPSGAAHHRCCGAGGGHSRSVPIRQLLSNSLEYGRFRCSECEAADNTPLQAGGLHSGL
ncbi:hypothetical protein DPMN_131920 [Dreissena polymorpha]|uniref:Alcohol dehydrogenase-like C-terminal domain-containing protein n=1 Tax=Dreissena polymorpha TaxID=45954 RepID=A0A9D4FU31_DREPO|nr:hypothetical protein DPMN_131920 [Dreissena polymorpha]